MSTRIPTDAFLGWEPIANSDQVFYEPVSRGTIGNHHVLTSINRVAPNYFETYGTPLLAGRPFSREDEAGHPVAIINQAMVRDYFGDGESPWETPRL